MCSVRRRYSKNNCCFENDGSVHCKGCQALIIFFREGMQWGVVVGGGGGGGGGGVGLVPREIRVGTPRPEGT